MSKKQNNNSSIIFDEYKKKIAKYSYFKKNKKLGKQNSHLLIGSPNVGKSTIFNKLTTSIAAVSNIDRVTVQSKIGKLKDLKNKYLVDLPGIYNLSHPIDEELIVGQEIWSEKFTNIVNVISASSLRRDLLLSIQLLETGKLSTIVVNMIDELNKKEINFYKLSKQLNNVPFVKTQANRSIGLTNIKKQFMKSVNANPILKIYPKKIEQLITDLSLFLPTKSISKRFIALMILENNVFIINELETQYVDLFKGIKKIIEKTDLNETTQLILDARNKFIDSLFSKIDVYHFSKQFPSIKQQKADKLMLNKWFAIPFFIILVFFIYYLSFGPFAGGYLQERLDYLFNDLFIDKTLSPLWSNSSNVGQWFGNLFGYGILSGALSVLSFIPVLIILFTCINILQQTGILSRVSVILDHALDKFGISGRSVINLLTGFGCNVPAIMMARSSNSKKEKIVSILITPFTICGARAIVLSFICNAIFGMSFGWIGVIIFIFMSGLIVLLSGLMFSKILFRRSESFFIIEMVKYRKPDLITVSKIVGQDLWHFIKTAGTIIVYSSLAIWFFLHLGTSSNNMLLQNNDIDQSVLCKFSIGINYLFYPIGFMHDGDWKFTASLLSAFPAKEIALANLNLLFTNVNSSLQSFVPTSLSYLTFLMFYAPCFPTMAVIKKEINMKNLFIHLGSALLISYVLSTLVYWISFAIVNI